MFVYRRAFGSPRVLAGLRSRLPRHLGLHPGAPLLHGPPRLRLDGVARELQRRLHGHPARDLFLIASRTGPHQRPACVVLKVMHIIYHLAGRQALLRLAISDDAIFREIELKVLRVVEELRAAGCAVAEFEWSRKPRDSQITKLLAKRSTLAANIYDKLRFRLIVPTEADLVPTLATLTRQLIPFNYIVPGESVNQLVDLAGLLIHEPHLQRLAPRMQPQEGPARRLPTANEFSGPEYRIINFVADLPLRLGRLVPRR